MNRAGLFVLALLLVAASQVQPDFSGRWVLDSPSPAPPDAATVLVVEQPITRVNVKGEPVTPGFATISIRRERATGVNEEKRWIGAIGGRVGGFAGPGRATVRSPDTHFETAWRDATLVLLDSQDGPEGPHTGDWYERRESWSLDPDGRLRVELVSESRDQPKKTVTLFYRAASR
jgi:hypothetical protein